jgi:hypothetical protein
VAESIVGQVVATEEHPSTPHQFHFWSGADASCGIGTIVRVDAEGRTVFGVIVEGFSYLDLARPLDAVLAAEGNPARTAGSRAAIRLWTVAVVRQLPAEPMQPAPFGAVVLASAEDVRVALRMETYTGGHASTGIPIGLLASSAVDAPVFLDADFLVGPEAAHFNISGVSGLATKTSAIAVLLSAIFQTFPKPKGSVAALCFNVKGPDLCFLDQPSVLSEEDLAIWHRLGLQAVPFADVTVYAPFKPDGVNLNTLRTNPEIAGAVQPLVWGLREVLDFAEVVLNRDDIDAKADALLDFLADRVVGKRYHAPELQEKPFEVMSLADLDHFFRSIFDFLETQRGAEVWRTHHAATIRKVRNRLGNIATRSKGLVTDDALVSDLPWGAFRDRSVHVVDIAGVDPLAQDLVFARLIARVREHLERRDLGVDHVIVFVDELNKYAPADGPDTYVKRMLLDLSERGRYLGLVLFSAQQFRSQVMRRVTGNAGTSAYGRMDSDELAMPGYATLSPAVKAKLASLPKGELMLRHPHFTQPVFIRFPRPASLSGREGVDRFPPVPDVAFEDGVIQRLKRLDPAISADSIRVAIDGRPEQEVLKALSAVALRTPDDVLAFFRGCLRRTIVAQPVEPRRGVAPLVRDDQDPFTPY